MPAGKRILVKAPDLHGPDEDTPAPREGRPVFPYPTTATDASRGNRRAVASFRRGDPLFTRPAPARARSDSFRPAVGDVRK